LFGNFLDDAHHRGDGLAILFQLADMAGRIPHRGGNRVMPATSQDDLAALGSHGACGAGLATGLGCAVGNMVDADGHFLYGGSHGGGCFALHFGAAGNLVVLAAMPSMA
jgi:hypothetical protein